MDLSTLNKDELKEVIETTAEGKGFELPKGWHARGEEKLIELAQEIEDFTPPEPEEVVKKGEAKVTGRSDMKKKILECEKVSVYVPEDQISKTNHVNIWVNGVEFIYAREQEYDMPQPVAEVYQRSLREERKARKKMESFAEIK